MKKFLGFTLAEMLVVMGIIGVVSALTLPNLNNSTSDQEKVAKFLKVHQNLNEALARATIAYGPYYSNNGVILWDLGTGSENERLTRFGKRMTKFLKVQKDCGVSGTGCFKSGAFSYLNTSTLGGCPWGYKVILADGTSLSFEVDGMIKIDIDGPNKGKHQYGDDAFILNVSNDSRSIVGSWEKYSADNLTFENLLNSCKQGNGSWGASWILKYRNMEYKKINSSGKCTNGITPTEDNPRCN